MATGTGQDQSSDLYDHELDYDLLRHPLSGPRWIVHPERDRRLIANPFLAIAAWSFAMGLISELLEQPWLGPGGVIGFVFGVATIAIWPQLSIRVHCWDCGATIHGSSTSSHDCDGVRRRREAGWRRGLRPPDLAIQTGFWVLATIVSVIVFWSQVQLPSIEELLRSWPDLSA